MPRPIRTSLRALLYGLFLLFSAASLPTLSGCGENGGKATIRVPVEPPRHVSLIFGGDVMQHMQQVAAARRDGGKFDYGECFRYLGPWFDSADFVIVNFETAVSPDGRYSGYPLFSSPPELAGALRDCGVDAVVMANNHVFDRGRRGLEASLAALDGADLRHTGIFPDSAAYRRDNPLYLEKNGMRLALFNYTYGLNGLPVPQGVVVNWLDTVQMAADLAQLDRAAVDHIVFYLHWGDEYTPHPNREQRQIARWCHDNGVDLVIGSHPHVLQPVETIADSTGRTRGVTAYSLGNLVSAQRKRRTDGGMILRIDIAGRPEGPSEIVARHTLTWVDIAETNGYRTFRILPEPVADTILREGTPVRAAYDRFITDSRNLLKP